MSIYKRGRIYWYKFMWRGEPIRESTKQGNDKVARTMESAHRTSLAKGEVGIREKKAAPTLAEFLKQDFVPYVTTKHAAKPNTVEYYVSGASLLCASDLAAMPLNEINDQHAQQFAAKEARWSASYVNRPLRTLRRALRLAYQWGKLEKPAQVTLARGERIRERVLSEAEAEQYLAACPQPWRDCATVIYEEGMRPGEVFALQWPHVLLGDSGGLIRIVDGKSRAARRVLPMTARVYETLRDRHHAMGRPAEGWIFPSASREGHFDKNSAKDQHAKGLKDSGVERFEPYCLRHTFGTRMALKCDVFTLARIMGHSSITITQRYVHVQGDSVEQAFTRLGAARLEIVVPVGTKLGTGEK
ncbi:MAG TPA: site-specific integrase [Terriglobia bacterium]|nr:site-specific integrase [Terriglobia bacterium]